MGGKHISGLGDVPRVISDVHERVLYFKHYKVKLCFEVLQNPSYNFFSEQECCLISMLSHELRFNMW